MESLETDCGTALGLPEMWLHVVGSGSEVVQMYGEDTQHLKFQGWG